MSSLNNRGMIVSVRNKLFSENKMWKDFYGKLKRQEDTDIEIISQHKAFGVHKSVLWFHSKFFEEYINKFPVKDTIFVKESQFPFLTIVAAMKYVYTGKVKLHSTRLQSLLAYINLMKLSNSQVEVTKVKKRKPGKLKKSKTVKPPIEVQPPVDVLEETLRFLANYELSPVKTPSINSSSSRPLPRAISPASSYGSFNSEPYEGSTVYSGSETDDDDEELEQTATSKRRLSISSDQQIVPEQKRVRFQEFQCTRCEFKCQDPDEYEQHILSEMISNGL